MDGAEGMCVKIWSEMMGTSSLWDFSLYFNQFDQLGGHTDRHS